MAQESKPLTQIPILLAKIKARFHEKLEAKTGWGKEEIKRLYDEATLEVLAELIS